MAGPEVLGELFDRIRLSMPGNDPVKLTPQQNADILAYRYTKSDPVRRGQTVMLLDWSGPYPTLLVRRGLNRSASSGAIP